MRTFRSPLIETGRKVGTILVLAHRHGITGRGQHRRGRQINGIEWAATGVSLDQRCENRLCADTFAALSTTSRSHQDDSA
jgi:hypothetical protein